MTMFYVSALIAIIGAVGYQYFVKLVPPTINPIVSIIGLYISVLVLGLILLPFYPSEGKLIDHIRQLNWIQVALAICVFLIELGFLLMFRNGWKISQANLVTGVFVNIILVGIGMTLLNEKVSLINGIGMAMSIIGVALISYRP